MRSKISVPTTNTVQQYGTNMVQSGYVPKRKTAQVLRNLRYKAVHLFSPPKTGRRMRSGGGYGLMEDEKDAYLSGSANAAGRGSASAGQPAAGNLVVRSSQSNQLRVYVGVSFGSV